MSDIQNPELENGSESQSDVSLETRAPKPVKKQPERMCIVTRKTGENTDLLRFVIGPDGTIVPDLKANLPGRGCWVTPTRDMIEDAIKRKAFKRAFKCDVIVDPDLANHIDRLFERQFLGALGLMRKSGRLVMGSAKTEAEVRSGKAAFTIHATDAATDGVRKISQGRKAVFLDDGPEIPAFIMLSSEQLGLALGAENVIHAAATSSKQAVAAQKCAVALLRYRGIDIASSAEQTGGNAPPQYELQRDTKREKLTNAAHDDDGLSKKTERE